MKNIKVVEDELTQVEHIIIYNEDDSQITMPKATYDAQLAAQSTPSIPEGEN